MSVATGRHRLVEQEVLVLGQEHHAVIKEPLPNSLIGGAPPTHGDDVLGLQAIAEQAAQESKREVLVEENLQDAWRTAGGR